MDASKARSLRRGASEVKDQISMFNWPPPFNDKPLAKVPDKVWRFETPASAEGREFLKLITEVDEEKIDRNYNPDQIEAWLYEMGYEWNGASWVPLPFGGGRN